MDTIVGASTLTLKMPWLDAYPRGANRQQHEASLAIDNLFVISVDKVEGMATLLVRGLFEPFEAHPSPSA